MYSLRCYVILKFPDLEVVALGITDEAFGFARENRNHISPTQRQFYDNTKLPKTIMRSFLPYGGQNAVMSFSDMSISSIIVRMKK